MKRWNVCGCAILCCTLAACGDPLKLPQLVEETRVLGARLEVASEPDRAWPFPGEAARVRWLVGEPAEPQPLGYHLEACVAIPSIRSVPECAAAPFARVRQTMQPGGEPTISLTLPSEAELGGAQRIALLGVVCPGGAPVTTSPWPYWSCEGSATSLASFDVTLASPDGENHNPSLADDTVLLDGAPWAEPEPGDPPRSGCAAAAPSDALPRVAAVKADHLVSVVFRGEDREVLTGDSGAASRERLQLAHLSTVGEFAGLFSFIEAEDERPEPQIDVRWTAPEAIVAEGWRARFFFVVRDQRGGADWTIREACVVP